MKIEKKRVFISDLPETATQKDIETAFSKYGKVSVVDIKERKKLDNNKSLFFAYINLDIDDRGLQKCFQDFADGEWLGQCVMLQVARESFLDRLKREREELNTSTPHSTDKFQTIEVKNKSKSGYELTADIEKKKACKSANEFNVNIEKKQLLKSNSEFTVDVEKKKASKSGSEFTFEIEKKEKSMPDRELTAENGNGDEVKVFNNSFDFNYKIKSNKGKLIGDVSKIPSVGNKPILTVDLHRKEAVNKSEANLKRLESLKKIKKDYQNQKSLIQAALLNVDGMKQNKIIFDSEDMPSKKRQITGENMTNSKQKRLLFNEESDEEHNVNIEIKQQFEGERGQKLLELQSKYKNDRRFTLDSRFLDDVHEDENNIEAIETGDLSIEEEKKKELEILSEVLGTKIPMKSQSAPKSESFKKPMLRFDPTQPEHSKYELANEGIQKNSGKKKRESETINEKKQEEKEQPNVSKEVFYKVKDNLKESLHEEKGFSLLNMFGTVDEKDKPVEDTPLEINKNRKFQEANPFRYESSDEDDQTEDIPNQADIKTSSISIDDGQAVRTKTNFWTESFFFKSDDYRLQEGFEFIEKMKFDEKADFSQLRRNLKEIVRAKVRNNQSKKKPFKRKLGGSKKRKMIRMKKALKK